MQNQLLLDIKTKGAQSTFVHYVYYNLKKKQQKENIRELFSGNYVPQTTEKLQSSLTI